MWRRRMGERRYRDVPFDCQRVIVTVCGSVLQRTSPCVPPPPMGIIGGMAVAAVDAWGRALETMTCANVITLGGLVLRRWRRRSTAACLQPSIGARRWAVRTPLLASFFCGPPTPLGIRGLHRAGRIYGPRQLGGCVRGRCVRPRREGRRRWAQGEDITPLKLWASPAAELCGLSNGELPLLPVASGAMAQVRACAGCTAAATWAPGGCFPAPK